ncbi:MAG: hypothetical protein LBH58_07535 [Tannerellaceae bacterium]|jgi:uncharacterized protein YjdB|nr:hypothetical protein [Tannerellaceae bacterium]
MNRKSLHFFSVAFFSVFLFACNSNSEDKENQIITFDELPSLAEGNELTLSATTTSGLPVSFRSTDPTYASVEGNKLKALKSGSVSIIAYQSGDNSFYEAPEIRRLLMITSYSPDKKNQTVTFKLDVSQWKISQGGLNLNGYATSSSGLPIAFSSSRESAATIDKNGELNVMFGIDPQTITIYASQPGNDEYNPALAVGQKIEVICDQH